MNDPISAEQAHQVAMVAANSAVSQFLTYGISGKQVAEAYLQAYEAVEGWTRPPAPVVEPVSTIPHVSLHYGQSVDLFNAPDNKYMRVTLKSDGSWDWSSKPKDA